MKTSTDLHNINNPSSGLKAHNYPESNSLRGEVSEPQQSTGQSARICPYCRNIIPASEDPCHYCGHLEPSASVNKDRSTGGAGSYLYFYFLAILFLCFGASMLISPEANPVPGYECSLYNSDECFFPYLVWGKPGGVVLILLSVVFIGWPLVSKRWGKKP